MITLCEQFKHLDTIQSITLIVVVGALQFLFISLIIVLTWPLQPPSLRVGFQNFGLRMNVLYFVWHVDRKLSCNISKNFAVVRTLEAMKEVVCFCVLLGARDQEWPPGMHYCNWIYSWKDFMSYVYEEETVSSVITVLSMERFCP